jgi:hypothetical protein
LTKIKETEDQDHSEREAREKMSQESDLAQLETKVAASAYAITQTEKPQPYEYGPVREFLARL